MTRIAALQASAGSARQCRLQSELTVTAVRPGQRSSRLVPYKGSPVSGMLKFNTKIKAARGKRLAGGRTHFTLEF